MKPTQPCACGCGALANPGRTYIFGHNRRGATSGPKAICSVDDCEKTVVARGWCPNHYRTLRDLGPCGVEWCDRPSQTAGLCSAHYKRKHRLGDPLAGGPLQSKAPKGSGCITPDGYRAHFINGARVYEHRLVMEQVLGRPLLPTESVHHLNGQRADNRPENLELWTTYQPFGQRVTDLVDYVANHYAAEVLAAIKEKS